MSDEHRKTKIVNPSYQYRAAYISVLTAIVAVNIVILMASLAPDWFGISLKIRSSAYYVIGVIEVLVILLAWRWSIHSTHHIAGPVFAIDRELKKLRDGDLSVQIKLRPGDEFVPHVESINKSLAYIRDEIKGIKDIAQSLNENSQSEDIERLLASLERLRTESEEVSSPESEKGE